MQVKSTARKGVGSRGEKGAKSAWSLVNAKETRAKNKRAENTIARNIQRAVRARTDETKQ